jgi:DNA-binding beta-propeller fold protein YncE
MAMAHAFTTVLTVVIFLALMPSKVRAGDPRGLLETLHRHVMRTSTIPENGDTNPYAILFAPVTAGKIHQGDILVDNFNNLSNLQGTGTTIVDFNPQTKKTTLFAKLPQHLPQCGVGLTTAMVMLKSGWVIVGSLPSTDGTTRTKGDGGLIVLNSNGELATVWTGPDINGPWGNIASIDNGDTATLFISMAGFDIPGPEVHDPATGFSVTVRKAIVLRLDLAIAPGEVPKITSQTIIASGFGSRADKDSFLVGPTGLALAADHTTLYASDALGNQIVAIPDATTRTDSAGAGRTVTKNGLLRRPLSLVLTPADHLLSCNAQNGEAVEIDPATGKQIYAQWIDADQAQQPPGNGDLFGIAIAPDGKSFYYVEDDMNALLEATK